MSEFADHLLSHLTEVDAVVVAEGGSLDIPDGWVLESVTYCNGKRIRTFRIGEANDGVED